MRIFGGEALYAQGCWAGELPLEMNALPARPAARLKEKVQTPGYLRTFARNFDCEPSSGLPIEPAVEAMRVTRIEPLAKDVRGIRLETVGDARLPPFAAGAHVKLGVVLPDETRDVRSYTMVDGDPKGRWCQIAVLREDAGNGGSRYLHDRVREGDTVRLEGAGNDFPVAPDTRSAVLICGGIGVTPMVGVAKELMAAGARIDVHYSARGSAAAALRTELARIAGERFHFYDTGIEGGRRMQLAGTIGTHAPGKHLYVCGPAGMVEAAIAAAEQAGYPHSAIHHELFKTPPPRVTDRPVHVHLKRSGAKLEVNPGTSILDAVLGIGIAVPHSCKRGECGECAVRVAGGEPSHRDHVLTPDQRAGGLACICVTWSESETLTLDL
jgi:ferredoxin-NADP reductase